MAAAIVGFLRGNEFKLILQDGRALSYYLLFFVVILLVNDRRLVLAFLRLLAFCVPVVFAIGAVYAALGQGMKLEYVEPGVSRFPAPDDVFLMSSVMTISFFTVWPPGRPRPRWLWGLLAPLAARARALARARQLGGLRRRRPVPAASSSGSASACG